MVFQLRSPTAFDNDQAMQPFVQSGKAILIKGDSLNKQDIENAWKAANQGSPIDLVLFTVGTCHYASRHITSTHNTRQQEGHPDLI